MSRRVTISVPDDVAEQLAALPARQVSSYVTEALRRRRASDDMRAALTAAGHREYPYDPPGAARRLAERRISPEVREAAIVRLAESTGRSVDEVRAELDRRAGQR
ncbi:hypothetical protein [Micromonospora sp. NPDC049679]|uniref:hypothetical protein n=1 Tax=Micromonospora sp. NPDC049679 TaxID=3155920 RepID=UPI00340AE084